MKLADAMVSELNQPTTQALFDMKFVARRRSVVEQKVDDLDKLHVWVVPEGLTAERLDRKQFARDSSVSIGVVRRLKATPTDAEIDQLVELTEQIVDHFTLTTPRLTFDSDNSIAATVLGFDWDPIYYPPHVRQFNQVTCVPVLNFQFFR